MCPVEILKIMALFVILNIGTFFDTLFILLLVYYGFRFFLRYFGPRVVEKAADKIYQDMKDREAAQNRHSVRKGDITIDFKDKKPKQYERNYLPKL